MHRRFSSTDKARFFFEPVEFYLQLANLTVKFVAFAFEFLLLGGVLSRVLEEVLEAIGGLLLPDGDEVGMDAEAVADFAGGLQSFERLQGDFRLEGRRVILAGARHENFLLSFALLST